MDRVAVEALSEEMIIAIDVYDYKDRLLLKKGTVLSKSSIDKLKNLGIKEVYVVYPGSGDDSFESEIEVQRLIGQIADLERKFANFTDNRLMINLKEATKKYFQEKIFNQQRGYPYG
jgi:hypothetical protein